MTAQEKDHELFDGIAMVCENCGRKCLYSELKPMGSIGRIGCPQCYADTGKGGVVPVNQQEWDQAMGLFVEFLSKR